jgi:molybdopterin-guanine dinucleotide biosynthesis protein B
MSTVAFVGRSNSGKTTLLEKLIPEMKKRGYRVATVKHAQEIELPQARDGARHLKAGSEVSMVVTGEEFVLVKPASTPPTAEDALRLLGNEYDIIFCEGFKKSSLPKIEVHRKEYGSLLEDVSSVVATVTDEKLPDRARQFSFDEVKKLADFIENDFIEPQQDSLSLYVNGNPVELTRFPSLIFNNTLMGMVSALKGVGVVRRLEIFLKKAKNQDGVEG